MTMKTYVLLYYCETGYFSKLSNHFHESTLVGGKLNRNASLKYWS